uniref:ZP domain-containing protein n=1 Tax=Syphacia muris TaxID=451379 RepID=A0A0N5AGF6_9BILA
MSFYGTPKVTCGPEVIEIEGETEDVFEGIVYVKHWRRSEGCATAYRRQQNSTHPRFTIPLDRLTQCADIQGIGDFHRVHVQFSSKLRDRRRSFIRSTLDISTKAIISGVSKPVKVVMSIQPDSAPDARIPSTVDVGEKLLYMWKVNEVSEVYGLRVQQCYAETRDGNKMIVINNGCSVDTELITHPKYSDSGLKAFANGHAFKFPDSDEIIITCVVETCIRRFEHLIVDGDKRLCGSPPKCDERQKRSTSGNDKEKTKIYSTETLVHQSLHVMNTAETKSLLRKLS